jgi:selenocysteine lyase/cysteine desulfurase
VDVHRSALVIFANANSFAHSFVNSFDNFCCITTLPVMLRMNPAAAASLPCQRHQFSLPEDVHYINCAYMSPLMRSVEQAGIEGMRLKALPHTIAPADFFTVVNRLKHAAHQLLKTPTADSITLLPSVSYGMSIVANNLRLQRGQNIVLVQDEFPSVVYPFERVCAENGVEMRFVERPVSTEERGKRWNEALLEAIDAKTAMLALSPVHWADGTLFNLAALRKRTSEVGALLVIDSTQCVGAMPFDVQNISPDAVIGGGYKWMFGPYGLGVAHWGEYFADGTPTEENWINRFGSEDFSRLVQYEPRYQPAMARFGMGEQSNTILVPMLTTAIRHILDWGVENIYAYCKAVTKPLVEALEGATGELNALGCSVENAAFRAQHLFGIRLPNGVNTQRVQQQLAEQHVFVSVRGAAVRVGPNVYNNSRDIEALCTALHQALR